LIRLYLFCNLVRIYIQLIIIIQINSCNDMPYLIVKSLVKDTKYNNYFQFKQLQELEQKIDWDDLVEAILPHYVKSKINPISLTIESMLRIYILGHYFDMSPSAVKKALIHVDFLTDFALIDLNNDEIPETSCIEDFNSVLVEKSVAIKLSKTEYSTAF